LWCITRRVKERRFIMKKSILAILTVALILIVGLEAPYVIAQYSDTGIWYDSAHEMNIGNTKYARDGKIEVGARGEVEFDASSQLDVQAGSSVTFAATVGFATLTADVVDATSITGDTIYCDNKITTATMDATGAVDVLTLQADTITCDNDIATVSVTASGAGDFLTLQADTITCDNDVAAVSVTASGAGDFLTLQADTITCDNDVASVSVTASGAGDFLTLQADTVTVDNGMDATLVSADTITCDNDIATVSVTASGAGDFLTLQADTVTVDNGMDATLVSADTITCDNDIATVSVTASGAGDFLTLQADTITCDNQVSAGSATLTGGLTVGTNADVAGTLNADTLDVDGACDIAGEITVGTTVDSVDGDFTGTLNADTLDVDGAVDIAGEITVGTTVDAVDADFTGTCNADTLDVDGPADFASTITGGGTCAITGDISATQIVSGNTLQIGNTAISATATELNFLDGTTVTTLDFNTLHDAADEVFRLNSRVADNVATWNRGFVPLVVKVDTVAHGDTNTTFDGTTIIVPQNALESGAGLRFTCGGTLVGGGAVAAFIIDIDGASIMTITQDGALAGDWHASATMILSGASVAEVFGTFNVEGNLTTQADYGTDNTADFSAGAITVKTRLTSGAGGDTITQEICVVEYLQGP
jgi:cytoskeletal protein CcmA (bactofilin family)